MLIDIAVVVFPLLVLYTDFLLLFCFTSSAIFFRCVFCLCFQYYTFVLLVGSLYFIFIESNWIHSTVSRIKCICKCLCVVSSTMWTSNYLTEIPIVCCLGFIQFIFCFFSVSQWIEISLMYWLCLTFITRFSSIQFIHVNHFFFRLLFSHSFSVLVSFCVNAAYAWGFLWTK